MGQSKETSVRSFLFLLLSINILMSCTEPQIDRTIDADPVKVEVQRLDQAMFSDLPSHEKLPQLQKEFPGFFPLYFKDVLQLGEPSDSLATFYLERFSTDPEWIFAQSQVDSILPDAADLNKGFSEAFGRYSSLFPERGVPSVYLMNSGFNYGVYPIPSKNVLAIGAEFYLGKENEMIERLPYELFPAYLKEQMNPEQIFPNAMKGWVLVNHREPEAKQDLLGLMVTYGKIMYALHLCIPDIEEHRQFAYTPQQYDWCVKNEAEIWKVIVKEDILFTTDKKTLTDWVGRGPFTQGFSEESPAELAYFMGKQIVKDYMADHDEISVQELMLVPAETILRSYTPD